MADFLPAVNKTLAFEGGYSNDPNDAGGATNFGVTLKVLQGFGEDVDFNHDGVVNAEDVKIMSRDSAIAIYKELYWRGDDIVSQAIAEKHFDIGVNMGVGSAAKLLQKAVLQSGRNINVDGNIGPKSLELINSIDEVELMTNLCDVQESYYWSIVQSNIEKKAASVYKWPTTYIANSLYAVSCKNVDLCKNIVASLRGLRLPLGNISFISGWTRRARDRFGI